MTKTETDPTKVTLHRDATVTYWSVHEQRWVRVPISRIPEREIAAMAHEARERVLAALERPAGASPPESARRSGGALTGAAEPAH